MRHFLGAAAAFTLFVGSAVSMAGPALAGPDEAQQDSFWANQSVSHGATSSNGQYLKVDPRDAQADSKAAASADASNPYFNHAMGTMSAPDAVAQAQSAPAPDSGRYTATYQQRYMQVDPADSKAANGSNVDGDNPYFYHSMGTMSRP